MKISTKIVAGYGILIVLMVGLLAHQVYSIHKMQSINKGLSLVRFRTAYISLRLLRDLDYVEDRAKKSFALGDPGYIAQLAEFEDAYDMSLSELKDSLPAEMPDVERLSSTWHAFTEDLSKQLGTLEQPLQEFPEGLTDQLDQLRELNQSVYQAALDEIDVEVEKAQEMGRQAEIFSWVMAMIALVLSCIVSFFIVQSISVPLKHLTQGTRAIAEGKFFYRLDTSKKDEFSQLAKDFNTMTQRLNELDQMKKDFVSHVSHELKAPLASMQETIQLILEEIPGPLTEKQRRLLELNLRSGRRLSGMIGNLLDLSRMEAGVMQYELQSNDMAELVRTVVDEFQPQAREKQMVLNLECSDSPLNVECDGDRIIQIVRNLIANALQFSPKGGTIRVSLLAVEDVPPQVPEEQRSNMGEAPEGRKFALVTVTDSGPGVPDDRKEKIFEKFHQVKQGKKMQGQGVGLGLAISRTIVGAHRGALWVEDNPEGGSVFSFMLPPGSASSVGQVAYRASSPL